MIALCAMEVLGAVTELDALVAAAAMTEILAMVPRMELAATVELHLAARVLLHIAWERNRVPVRALAVEDAVAHNPPPPAPASDPP